MVVERRKVGLLDVVADGRLVPPVLEVEAAKHRNGDDDDDGDDDELDRSADETHSECGGGGEDGERARDVK